MIHFFNNILNNALNTNTPNRFYPSYNRIKQLAGMEINNVKNYWYNSYRYLKRPNPLIKLLVNFDLDIGDTPENIFNYLTSASSYLANSIGLINTTNRNDKPFTKTIMATGNEYLVVANTLLAPTANKYILDKSISVLYASPSDYFFTHPKYYTLGISEDYYIFGVDLVKLGLGFYYWSKEQIILDNDTDPARYLYTVVLTNLIDELTDTMYINRLMCEYEKSFVTDWTDFNPMFIPDYSNYYEKIINYSIKNLKSKHKRSWEEVLNNIPVLLNVNALNVLRLPEISTNRRNEWAFWLARMPYLTFLIKHFDKRQNRDLINDIKNSSAHSLEQLTRDSYFNLEDSFTYDLFTRSSDQLKKLIK